MASTSRSTSKPPTCPSRRGKVSSPTTAPFSDDRRKIHENDTAETKRSNLKRSLSFAFLKKIGKDASVEKGVEAKELPARSRFGDDDGRKLERKNFREAFAQSISKFKNKNKQKSEVETEKLPTITGKILHSGMNLASTPHPIPRKVETRVRPEKLDELISELDQLEKCSAERRRKSQIKVRYEIECFKNRGPRADMSELEKTIKELENRRMEMEKFQALKSRLQEEKTSHRTIQKEVLEQKNVKNVTDEEPTWELTDEKYSRLQEAAELQMKKIRSSIDHKLKASLQKEEELGRSKSNDEPNKKESVNIPNEVENQTSLDSLVARVPNAMSNADSTSSVLKFSFSDNIDESRKENSDIDEIDGIDAEKKDKLDNVEELSDVAKEFDEFESLAEEFEKIMETVEVFEEIDEPVEEFEEILNIAEMQTTEIEESPNSSFDNCEDNWEVLESSIQDKEGGFVAPSTPNKVPMFDVEGVSGWRHIGFIEEMEEAQKTCY